MNALQEAWRRDPVTPLGGAIGLAALLSFGPWRPGWLTYRPNRLAEGETFGIFQTAPGWAWLLAGLWLAVVAVALVAAAARTRRRPAASGRLALLTGFLIVAAAMTVLVAAGGGASSLVGGAPPSARVSLGGGVWLSLVAAYVAMYGASAAVPRRTLPLLALVGVMGAVWLVRSGMLADLGLARELASQGSDFRAEIGRHLALALTSLVIATAVGLPAAIVAARDAAVARWVLPTAAFFQTLPSLALFGLLLAPLARLGQGVTVGEAARFAALALPLAALLVLPRWAARRARRSTGSAGAVGARLAGWLRAAVATALAIPLALSVLVAAVAVDEALTALFGGGAAPAWPGASASLAAVGVRGIGSAPALIALTLYALLPIVRNTYTGLKGVPADAIEAGRGMGMSPAQLLRRVEWPLAMPLVMEGLRAASVLIVGITTVAYLIGAGGLGVFIQRGIDQVVPDLVLLGAVPVILLALAADALLRGARTLLTPRALREAKP